MTNPYYNHTSGVPAADTKGLSSALRSEFDGIAGGFDSVDAALDAVFAGGGLASTSVTSLTIGTGSKSLTVAASLSFAAGQYVVIASTAAPTVDYMEGRITSYNSTTGALVVSVSTSAGSGTLASWIVGLQSFVYSPSIPRRAITGTDTVISSDLGKLIDVTSGTFTLAGTASATLGAGFYCHVRNSGTGVVTFDPASSETVDALTTIHIYPGESFLLQCDGSNWHTVGRQRVVLIGTSTVSSPVSTVDFETGFDDTEFDEIIVRGYGVAHNGAVARLPRLRLKLAGAYATASYVYQALESSGAATIAGYDQTTSAAGIQATASTVAVGDKFSLDAKVLNISTATNQEHVVEWSCHALGGRYATGRGGNSGGSAVQGLRLLMNADSISAGTFNVYGMRKS